MQNNMVFLSGEPLNCVNMIQTVIMHNLDHYIKTENENPNPNIHLTGYIFK